MIQNKELIDWFNNYFDNCYYVKHEDYPESIFMFYDVNYVRQLKLAKLDGKKYVEKTDITGVCLFEQDWKNNWFCCDHDNIWCYLRENYSFNHSEFNLFIKDRLEERSKFNILTPYFIFAQLIKLLEERSKFNILTPCLDARSYKNDTFLDRVKLKPKLE